MSPRSGPGLALIVSIGMLAGCHHLYHPGVDGTDVGNDAANVGDLAATTCDTLACRIDTTCAGGGHTTLHGKVYAPNGTLPLYNATVFVPSTPVASFPTGVTCDRCDGKVSGDPLAVALTGPDGSFTLTDVPSGADVPLVIQLGRWRRQVTIPAVVDCADNAIVDIGLTRLPRNRSEGDLPQIAIATGASDPFECLLLKIGLDAAEITSPNVTAPGRIHFYRATNNPGTDLAAPAPRATQLYASLANLLRYDVVLLPCEGGAYDKSQVDGAPLPNDPRSLLSQYLDAGGRVFSTHYSYDWVTYTGSPYNQLAAPLTASGLWPVGQADDYNNTIHAALNVTFPKGVAFAQWLLAAGASSTANQLYIAQERHDLTSVDPAYAQAWASYDFAPVGGGPGVVHFTANMPLDPPKDDMGAPAYCGRMVFSDFHVTANAISNANLPFPEACKSEPMTDQEKALAFMLFDLSSCVQQDSTTPIL